ncbi:hypothetical protein MFRU_033g00270 [Monilinia fructicola]|nr:hypothetical protein MFRU_033g00270 [Monilinia fructicola]
MIKSTTLVLLMITGVDEKVIANPSNSSTNVPLRRRTALRSSLMEVAGGVRLAHWLKRTPPVQLNQSKQLGYMPGISVALPGPLQDQQQQQARNNSYYALMKAQPYPH